MSFYPLTQIPNGASVVNLRDGVEAVQNPAHTSLAQISAHLDRQSMAAMRQPAVANDDSEFSNDFDVTPILPAPVAPMASAAVKPAPKAPKAMPKAVVTESAPAAVASVASLATPAMPAASVRKVSHGPIWDKLIGRLDSKIAYTRDRFATTVCEPRKAFSDRGYAPGEKERRITALRNSLALENSPEKMSAVLAEVAALESIDWSVTFSATRQICLGVEAMRPVLHDLLDHAELHLAAMLTEAEAIEKSFFESQGVPYVPTEVSNQIRRVQDRISVMRPTIDPRENAISGSDVWTWGIDRLHPLL